MFKITQITVLGSFGTDKLILHTDLPDGCWPYAESATLTLDVAHGQGEAYCEANFPGVPVKVVG